MNWDCCWIGLIVYAVVALLLCVPATMRSSQISRMREREQGERERAQHVDEPAPGVGCTDWQAPHD